MSAYLHASALVPTIVKEPGSAAVDTFISQYRGTLVISEFAVTGITSAPSG